MRAIIDLFSERSALFGGIFYTDNGNLAKDLNKGISNITYNLLILSMTLKIASPSGLVTNKYAQAADGRKLKTVQ